MSDYPEYPDEAVIREWVAHVAAKYPDSTVGWIVSENLSDSDDPSWARILDEAGYGPDGWRDDALIQWSSGWRAGCANDYDEDGVLSGVEFMLFDSSPSGMPGHISHRAEWWDLSPENLAGADLITAVVMSGVMEWRQLHEWAKRIVVMPTLARSA